MKDIFASEELFQRLLRRERLYRRAVRMAAAVLVGLVAGIWILVCLADHLMRESYRLGSVATATVTKVEAIPDVQSLLRVSYVYTVGSKQYTDSESVKRKDHVPAPGEQVQIEISARAPTIARLAKADRLDLVARSRWALLALLLVGVIVRQIRAALAPRKAHLRRTLATLVESPETPADARSLFAVRAGESLRYPPGYTTPQRWLGWSPDRRLDGLTLRWWKAQNETATLADFLARLLEADRAFHPEEVPPASRQAEPAAVFEAEEGDSAYDQISAATHAFTPLRKGEADTLVLDLAGFDDIASRPAVRETERRLSEAHKGLGLRDLGNWQKVRERYRAVGLPAEFEKVVPLRHEAAGAIVSERKLTAMDAAELIDSMMVRFGFAPEPTGPREASGWIPGKAKGDAKRIVRLSYRPHGELRVTMEVAS